VVREIMEESMPFRVDHFAFRVSDLDKAIKFYQDILSLKLLSKTVDEERHEAFAFLELAGGKLELLQLLDENNSAAGFEKQKIDQSFCPHLAIRTENLDPLILDLSEKKVNIVKGPMEIPGLAKWLYIADTDNNIIEFVEWK